MRVIWNIGANTFREAIRNRVLYIILVFAFFFILGSRFLGSISVGQDVKIIKDMGLAGISLFAVLVAIFVGTSIVYQEIERRTIYTILSKPVRRREFVIGKYLGLCMTLATVVAAMTVVLGLQLWLVGAGFDLSFLVAISLTLAELFVITSVAVLFSTVASPLLSAVFTFCFYIIGHTIRNILGLLQFVDSDIVRRFLSGIYFVLPNLDNFNVHREVVHGLPLAWPAIGYSLGYGVAYSALMLTLAALALGKRDF